ncbi:MAG: DUF192 domain-containing protein [Ignavibacteria bacterium]|nr:MAG: DUF192 domain-containing protein [Ignavibacteria bacterium]
MSKSKNKKSPRKALKEKKQNKKLVQAIVFGVIIVFALVYIFKPNQHVKTTRTNKMNYESPYKFTKQGELSFQTKDEQFITKIDIEIANTDYKRSLGLMYRNKMEENQGMLFIFPDNDYRSFWMKNTIIPLDMIFVSSNFEIINIRKNTTPFDESQYTSTAPAKYVIEVVAGFTDKFNIKPGDKISYSLK